MNRLANIALLVAVAAIAMTTQHLFSDPHLVVDQPKGTSWEAKVISVDASSSAASGLKHALVKLSSGETVRASVPGGCVIFPGQTTRVAKLGQGSGSAYVISENGK